MTYDSDDVVAHFREKFREFGPDDALGVDWSNTGQHLRFEVIWEEAQSVRKRSILDAGCGAGHFLNFLKSEKGWAGQYRGFDLVDEMVEAAQKAHPEASFFKADVRAVRDMPVADLVVCCGLFAFMPLEDVQESLEILWARTRKALIFNTFSTWASLGPRDDDIFTHDPFEVMTLCRKLTPWMRLRHDYLPADYTVTLLKDRSWAQEGFSW
jgi:SAM-dependent methyltransferase